MANHPATPIVAVMNRYALIPETLFANGSRPALDFGEVPQTDEEAKQKRIPYCRLEENEGGCEREVDSENGGPEAGYFTLTAYDFDLGDVARTALAIRFAGRAPKDRAGLDGGALDLCPPFSQANITLHTITYAREPGLAPKKVGTLQNGSDQLELKVVHKAVMTFRVAYSVRSTG